MSSPQEDVENRFIKCGANRTSLAVRLLPRGNGGSGALADAETDNRSAVEGRSRARGLHARRHVVLVVGIHGRVGVLKDLDVEAGLCARPVELFGHVEKDVVGVGEEDDVLRAAQSFAKVAR